MHSFPNCFRTFTLFSLLARNLLRVLVYDRNIQSLISANPKKLNKVLVHSKYFYKEVDTISSLTLHFYYNIMENDALPNGAAGAWDE